MTILRSNEVICKGNLTGNFELVPMELFDYLELGLITRNDFVVYVRLLKQFNPDYGYAFPTISQLMVSTRIGGKGTIDDSLDNLESVGLIKRVRAKGRDNNVYLVYKPLEKQELYECVPDRVQKIVEYKEKKSIVDKQDKERLSVHKQTKLENEQLEITARQIEPTLYNPPELNSSDLSPEEKEEIEKLNRLPWGKTM